MTKIAMVSMSYYPNDPRIRKQAECLTREGFFVDIICLRGPAEPKVEQLGRVRVYRKVKGRDKESMLTYLRLSALFMISAFLMLQKLTLRNRYQLLHIHNMPDYLVFVGIVQKILRIPIILDLHDLSVELFETKWPGRASPPVIFVVRFAEKMSCRFADSVITTSSGFRHKLINRGIRPDKISLIINSADGRIFKKKSLRQFLKIRKGAQLLYHGSVAERFGVLTAVEAVARLQTAIPGSTLRIFGKYDPTCRRKLEQRIEALGLHNLVFLGEWRSLEEIRDLIEESDMGIVPYQNDAFMNLALSTKTFEYVAMGLPIVAARLPSLTAIFREDCLNYFTPSDTDDLVNKLIEFCLAPDLRKTCAENASAVYQRIAWPVIAQRYFNLVTGLLNKSLMRPQYTQTKESVL